MNKRAIKKEALIHEAAKLFTKSGYYNTSIADIAKQCQLKKASIYNYIVSKEQLAHDTLQQVHQYIEKNILVFGQNKQEDVETRLVQLLQVIETFYLEHPEATLFIKVGLDLAKEPAFQMQVRTHFDAWINLFNNLLTQLGHSPERANALAKQTLAELNGAVLLAEIYGNPQGLKTFCRQVYSTFQTSKAKALA